MPPLPVVTPKDAISAFEKDGWSVARQNGSHITMTKPGERNILTIPNHKEVSKGVLRSNIQKAGLSIDDFYRLLDR